MRLWPACSVIAIGVSPVACMLFRSLDDLSNGSGAAASDSGSDADAAIGSSPCTRAHTLCDDFDRDDAGVWSSEVDGAASLALDTFKALSPPRALHVQRTTFGPAGARAVLHASLPSAVSRTRCEFDIFISKMSGTPGAGAEVLTFRFGDQNPYVRLSTSEIELFSGSTRMGAASWNGGRWTHVAVDYRWELPVRLGMTVDGHVVVDGVAVPNTANAPVIQVALGAWFESTSDLNWDLAFDNAFCDSDP